MDYWNECISEAFDEAGIDATKEQIDGVAEFVEGAHENYGMAFGHDCIPNPMKSEVETLNDQMQALKQEHRNEVDKYRGSVARRHRVDINRVYLDGATVMISAR